MDDILSDDERNATEPDSLEGVICNTDKKMEKKDGEKSDSKRVGFWEYFRVFACTEGGAYAGANAGIYLSAAFTKSALKKTGGVLSGDYIGGTLGQLGSYWYNNREKFRDENGKTNYLRLAKDFSKMLLYDLPATAAAYAIASPFVYYMNSRHWRESIVAVLSTLTVMTIWNSLNYFAYSVVKKDADENLIQSIGAKLTSRRKRKS